jgi:DNA-binding protein YbaB
MAQALIREAMNDAVGRAQSLVQEEANREAQALGLPGLPGLGSLLN